MKLIIDIPEKDYEFTKGAKTARYFPSEYYVNLILNGTPLDNVKAEIEEYRSTIDRAISEDELKIEGMKEAYTDCLKIIDNIGKADVRDKI